MPSGRLKRTVAGNEPARWLALKMVQARARLDRGGRPPRVFATSVPKAGMHLVTAILDQLPEMRFSGLHLAPDDFSCGEPAPISGERPAGRPVDRGRLRTALERARNGQYVRAHFPPDAALLSTLDELGYRTVFVYRDPRDVAVSHAFYVTRLRRHQLHHRYAEVLKTDAERILASITGFPSDGQGEGLASLSTRVGQYRQWLTVPGVLACRFEELVGERGGGSSSAQLASIQRIASHVARPLSEEQAEAVARRAWSSGSVTFRKGAIGDWANHFDQAHREAFRGPGARLLADYRYEIDDGWIGDG